MTKLKVAVLVSSLFASTAFAQSTPPSQAAGAPASAQPPVQIAQGSGAPGAVSGAQASGVAAAEAGAAAAAGGAGLGIPFAVAAGLTAVGAASTNENGEVNNAGTTHH